MDRMAQLLVRQLAQDSKWMQRQPVGQVKGSNPAVVSVGFVNGFFVFV
jgi:hypothetical protein